MFLAPPPIPDEEDGGDTYQRDEARRRRGKDKYLRSLSTYQAALKEDDGPRDFSELYIQGYAAEIFTDDATALHLHAESHMIRWRGETQDPIVIDRFDGRALLDDRSKFIKLKSRRRGAEDDDASAEEAMLDKERFRDLEREDDVSGPSAQGDSGSGEAERPGGAQPEGGEEVEEAFVPSFPVPPGLVLPPTYNVHRLIGITARRARKEAQFEFLVKVRQADNPQFSFLHPDDPLHPYYNYMKEEEREPAVDYSMDPKALKEAKVEEERKAQEAEARKKQAVRSLLGSAYFDSDEEEDEEEEILIPPKELKVVIDKLAQFVIKNGEAFEQKVRERESKNPKFSFLQPEDPYYRYYCCLLPNKDGEGKKKKKKKKTEEDAKAESEAAPAPAEPMLGPLDEGRAPIVIQLPKSMTQPKKAEGAEDDEEEQGEGQEEEAEGGVEEGKKASEEGEAKEGEGAKKEEAAKEGAESAAEGEGVKDNGPTEGGAKAEEPAEEEEGEKEGAEQGVESSEEEREEGEVESEEDEEEMTEEEKKRQERLRRARMMRGHFSLAMINGLPNTSKDDDSEEEEGEVPMDKPDSEASTSGKRRDDKDASEDKERKSKQKRKRRRSDSHPSERRGRSSRRHHDSDDEDEGRRKKKKKKHKRQHDDRSRSRGRSRSRERRRREKSRSRSRGDSRRSRETESRRRRSRSRSRDRRSRRDRR